MAEIILALIVISCVTAVIFLEYKERKLEREDEKAKVAKKAMDDQFFDIVREFYNDGIK